MFVFLGGGWPYYWCRRLSTSQSGSFSREEDESPDPVRAFRQIESPHPPMSAPSSVPQQRPEREIYSRIMQPCTPRSLACVFARVCACVRVSDRASVLTVSGYFERRGSLGDFSVYLRRVSFLSFWCTYCGIGRAA